VLYESPGTRALVSAAGALGGPGYTAGRVFTWIIIRSALFSGVGARSYGRSIGLPGGPVDRSARSGFEAHPLSVVQRLPERAGMLPLSERLPAGVRVSARLVHA
jgi:hypothetical protein